jgi:hypothetical protein
MMPERDWFIIFIWFLVYVLFLAVAFVELYFIYG